MNNPNASSCLHFTKKMETLKLILQNGIRYSYAFEFVPKSIIENFINDWTLPAVNLPMFKAQDDWGMAIPMISFCDIPITRANEHAMKYGKYIFGLDKDFFFKFFTQSYFNPVFYICSETVKDAFTFFTAERLRASDRMIQRVDVENIENVSNYKDLSPQLQKEIDLRSDATYYSYIMLALYKPIFGLSDNGKIINYYNEREWRCFVPHVENEKYAWVKACSKKEFELIRDDLNEQLNNCEEMFISIPTNCWDAITHIVVKYDYQRDLIIDFIMKSKKLFGHIVEKDNSLKLKLISKISSFERTETDY